MNTNSNTEMLSHIKGMMESSSRFVSLSGLSGIAAGTCALIGAAFARYEIANYYDQYGSNHAATPASLFQRLLYIAILVFVAALASALFFTWRKCRLDNTPFGGYTSRKLMYSTLLPMLVGGVFILKLMQTNAYDLVAPACLIFYGLALINGSKHTLGEIRWVGYINLLLGMCGLWLQHYHLLLWTLGFGIAHIIYGWWMWKKYESTQGEMD